MKKDEKPAIFLYAPISSKLVARTSKYRINSLVANMKLFFPLRNSLLISKNKFFANFTVFPHWKMSYQSV